ncbi:MAG: ATPase [Leifsonia xyli]|jgi:hypothetical protein|nr:MAG: ATPase [Leifsonia xyli]
MSRNELVQKLAEAGIANDREALKRTMDALISEAHAEQAHGFAERMTTISRRAQRPSNVSRGSRSASGAEEIHDLVLESKPRRRLKDLVLGRAVEAEVVEFLNEFAHSDLLRANSLEPRHTVLLIGPPGNGKTSLAEAIAAEAGLTLLTVRYDGLIGSYMGETASRVRRLLHFASSRPCLVFFDEFDAIGKERGDNNEMGEIKRVVSSLLLQLDQLPSRSIVVCATNHPEMLDRAVWRRFELRLHVAPPGKDELLAIYKRLQKSLGKQLPLRDSEFVTLMTGENFSEVEAFELDVRRQLVLGMGRIGLPEAFGHALHRREMLLKPDHPTSSSDADQPAASSTPARRKSRRQNTKPTPPALPFKI